jgi:pilus assembly protein Flp/PilA
MKWILALLRDEDGPTAVEYAVMLGLILCAIITAVSGVGTGTNGLYQLFMTASSAAGAGS